jgi:Flp pilus assembly protein TadD
MARSALLRGDFGGATLIAAQAADRGTEQDSETQVARVFGGLARIMAGQVTEGIATVSEAARRLAAMGSVPDAAKAWRDLAEALIERGQSAEAIEALRQAADCAGVRASAIRPGAALPVLG